jgi:hypothetical protein
MLNLFKSDTFVCHELDNETELAGIFCDNMDWTLLVLSIGNCIGVFKHGNETLVPMEGWEYHYLV